MASAREIDSVCNKVGKRARRDGTLDGEVDEDAGESWTRIQSAKSNADKIAGCVGNDFVDSARKSFNIWCA